MVGASPDFSDVHLMRTLLILKRERIGRKKLVKMLGLGEGSVRTILRSLKDKNLIKSSKSGHELTSCGFGYIKEYLEKFTSPIEFSSPDLKDFIGENKASLIISHNASSRIRKGVEQRDTAIKAGADGAIILVYEDELRFPVSDISLPEFKDKFFDLKKGDVVILGFADNYADAENGAIAIALDLI